MIRINELKLPIHSDISAVADKAAGLLCVSPRDIESIKIVRRSVDARRREELSFVYSVDIDLKKNVKVQAKGRHNIIMSTHEERYVFPCSGKEVLKERPVIVGSGPAGLFAGYLLALHGYRPLILERGKCAIERTAAVKKFWKEGIFDPECNAQFGEGGAGTFSDGKLNTSVKDPLFRAKFIKETFTEFGAPEEILYDQKPHLGTDILSGILVRMRSRIEELGGEYRFSSKVTGIRYASGTLAGLEVNGGEYIPAAVCILAPGHSSRDTFSMLYDAGIKMQAKSFAAGIRIEHPQKMINLSQYGNADIPELGPAPYKLTHSLSDGRGIYSFCMCPGGYVINASSENEMLVVNGMSYSKRDSDNANSALIVTVTPDDFAAFRLPGQPDVFSGVEFQKQLESLAFRSSGGAIPQQLYSDFRKGVRSSGYGDFVSCVKGQAAFADLSEILPEYISYGIMEGIESFGTKIRGFDRPDAILSGTESRSSSPVRILRDEKLESSLPGLYPCGEGAGYAGGIMSAAMDGMRCAEAISEKYLKLTP